MQNIIGGGDFANLMGQSRVNQLGGRFINGRPLPLQTRRRIVEMHICGIKPCKISRDLQVSHGAVSKILNRYAETGSIAPGQIGGNPRSRLSIQSVQGHILALKHASPGATAAEICEALVQRGVCTPENVPTICSVNRHLRSRGLKSRKNQQHELLQRSAHIENDPQGRGQEEEQNKDLSDETWMSEYGSAAASSSSVSSTTGSYLSPDCPQSSYDARANDNADDNEVAISDNAEIDVLSVSDNEAASQRDNNSDSRSSDCCSSTSANYQQPFSTTTASAGEQNNLVVFSVKQRDDRASASRPQTQHKKSGSKCLTHGINMILGVTATTSSATTENGSLNTVTNSSSFCVASSSLAPSPLSDEENYQTLSTTTKSKTINNKAQLNLDMSSTTSMLPDSSTTSSMQQLQSSFMNHYQQQNPNNVRSVNWASGVGGLAEYRRNRTSFTGEQLKIMDSYFTLNHYPTEAERLRLVKLTDLDEDKIITWFSNRRARHRKNCCKQFPFATAFCQNNDIKPILLPNKVQINDSTAIFQNHLNQKNQFPGPENVVMNNNALLAQNTVGQNLSLEQQKILRAFQEQILQQQQQQVQMKQSERQYEQQQLLMAQMLYQMQINSNPHAANTLLEASNLQVPVKNIFSNLPLSFDLSHIFKRQND